MRRNGSCTTLTVHSVSFGLINLPDIFRLTGRLIDRLVPGMLLPFLVETNISLAGLYIAEQIGEENVHTYFLLQNKWCKVGFPRNSKGIVRPTSTGALLFLCSLSGTVSVLRPHNGMLLLLLLLLLL